MMKKEPQMLLVTTQKICLLKEYFTNAAPVEGIISRAIISVGTLKKGTVGHFLISDALCAAFAMTRGAHADTTFQILAVLNMCRPLNLKPILSKPSRRCPSIDVTCVHAVFRAAKNYVCIESMITVRRSNKLRQSFREKNYVLPFLYCW